MKSNARIFKAHGPRLVSVLIVIWYFRMLTAGFGAAASSNEHNLTIHIAPQFNGHALAFNKLFLTNSAGQNLSVTRLDFLISDFALHRGDGTWFEKINSPAFLNLGENRSSFTVEKIPEGSYDKIRFHVGLRPEINHSKPEQYPANHPLNPNLNRLHWGWAGGYVFFAVEGNWRTSDGMLSGYSFHLGNDPMLMTVELPVSPNFNADESLELALDINRILNFKLSEEKSSTHSRKGDEFATQLRAQVESAFTIQARSSLSRSIADIVKPLRVTDPRSNVVGKPYRFTFSSQFPIPDLPRDNPLTEEGVELGHRLFGEKLLSINSKQSCASCHREQNAFSDAGKKFSVGAEGIEGTRNAMPIFNLAWKKYFFWDGRAATLREQVLIPIQNPIEMHESLDRVVSKLSRAEFYPAEFQKVFGSREITSNRIARVLEQFILTQVSFDSKFDRAIEGRETLTDEEKRGFELFTTEYDPRREQFGADCFHCHGGPLFQSQTFANNGLDVKFSDLGRFGVTKSEGDEGKFAVPSLRNVEATAPYMHDGRFKSLEEVVEHYTTGMKRSATLDPNLAKHPDGGLNLPTEDQHALVSFLKTLTDERFRIKRP